MSMKKQMLSRHLRVITADKFKIDLNMPADYPAIDAPITEEGGVRERFLKSVKELPSEITVVHPFSPNGFKESNEKTVYVSPSGCDSADGSKASPLKTVACALEKFCGKKGGRIILREGHYNIDKPLKITDEHSGTESSPLIITAEEGETPHISSCLEIPFSSFVPLTDKSIRNRLKDSVRDKVLVCDLKALGISKFGSQKAFGGISFAINGIPQKYSRYPKEGAKDLSMGRVISDRQGSDRWEVELTDERPTEWMWNDSILLYGSLSNEWTRHFGRLSGIDREKRSFYSDHPFDSLPIICDLGNSFHFENIIEELEAPGEFCIDFSEGKIYYLPSESFTEDSFISYAYKPCTLFECSGAENIIIDRLTLGENCGYAIRATDCRQVLVQRCHLIGSAATGDRDDEAFTFSGGFRNGIIDSVIEYFSCRAGSVVGGDRKHLIPANNFIQNCKIVNPLLRFGISSGGCGNIVSHNYSHNTTMGDCGHNEGIIEYNIIEGGDTEVHDSGMIYVAGGGCSSCANHYRYNYLFDFAKCDYGIYFDDLSRGMYAYGNIVVGNGTDPNDRSVWHGGGRSFNHHNGGEHCFFNNISIDAGYFAFGGDVNYWYMPEGSWRSFFDGIYDAAVNMSESKKYMDRNPTYKDFVKAVFSYKAELDKPGYVEKSSHSERRLRTNWCNHYENNLIVRASRPYKLDVGEDSASGIETNFITNESVGFVNEEAHDYRLNPDSIVFEKIRGFVAPPFEKMGPINDQ
jgi:hypothetical protein